MFYSVYPALPYAVSTLPSPAPVLTPTYPILLLSCGPYPLEGINARCSQWVQGVKSCRVESSRVWNWNTCNTWLFSLCTRPLICNLSVSSTPALLTEAVCFWPGLPGGRRDDVLSENSLGWMKVIWKMKASSLWPSPATQTVLKCTSLFCSACAAQQNCSIMGVWLNVSVYLLVSLTC